MKRRSFGLMHVVGRQLERSFATLLAVLAVALLLFGMPQAANVLWQWPGLGDGPLWLVLGFYVFIAGVLALDAWLLIACMPSERSGSQRRSVLAAPTRLAARMTSGRRLVLACILIVIGASTWLAPFAIPGLDRTTTVAAAIIAVAYGLWLALVRVEGGAAGMVSDTLGRALTAATLTLALGELLWAAIARFPGTLSNRNYTIWALIEVGFLTILVARVLDALQRRWRRSPLRLVALISLLVFVGLSGRADVGAAGAGQRTGAEVDLAWLDAVERRLREMPDDAPVVLVSASGGGSRAALFTALVLESLFHEPVEGAGPGVRIADHILAISAVSGGSLATAWYTTGPVGKQIDEPLATTAVELAAGMREIAEGAVARAGDQDEAAESLVALAETCRALEQAVATGTEHPALPVPFYSAYADAMSTDYMAPVLRGTLLPGVDRARSLVRAWNGAFGWNAIDAETPFDPTRPLILLNAALSAHGRSYVFGMPRPPAELCAPDLRTISQDDPAYRITLSEMVRLSAGFPWLAPIARVRPAGASEAHHVVDGGVVDNTGMETLAALFRRLVVLSDWESSPDDEQSVRAVRIVETIRRRGLVVVEIDSGAKKRAPGLGARLLPNLLEPMDALQISIDNNALRARDRALNDIVRMYLAKKPDGQLLAKLPLSVRFSCDHFEDVMTAWALGPRDKAAVWTTFLFEAASVLPELERALTAWRPRVTPPAQLSELPSLEELLGPPPAGMGASQGRIDAEDAARASLRGLLGDRERDPKSGPDDARR